MAPLAAVMFYSALLWAAVEEAAVNPARSRPVTGERSSLITRRVTAGRLSHRHGRGGKVGGALIREPGDSGRSFLHCRAWLPRRGRADHAAARSEPAVVAVFAGDHGVHAQRVTPWPQEVTAQMVANFLALARSSTRSSARPTRRSAWWTSASRLIFPPPPACCGARCGGPPSACQQPRSDGMRRLR